MRGHIYLAALCLLSACSPESDVQSDKFLSELTTAMASGDAQVQVNTLTAFDWDQVCHLERADDSLDPPSIEDFIAKHGLKNTDTSIRAENYQTAFVFSKDNFVIKTILLPQINSRFLFDDRSSGQCIDSELAAIAFEKRALAGQERTVMNFKHKGD